ncbi:MAG: tetratricopeptide repeat protein [Microgenomates group bacterium]
MKQLTKIPIWALVLIIFLFGFGVYFNILPNQFVWDDEEQVVNNPYIRSFANLQAIFKGSTFNTGGAGLSGWYYKPLMSLWFMTNFAIWGLNPFGFHLSQLFLHLVNSGLIFLIFLKLFDSLRCKIAKLIAFFSALIFLVHPANVESVAYISASQEVLYTFFLLLGLWLLSQRLDSLSLGLAILLFFLALLSKESAVVGIPLIFLYLWLVKNKKRMAFGWLVGSGLIFLFYFWLRTFIAKIPFSASHLSPISQAPLIFRLLTLPFEIFSYLRLIFFPKVLAIAQHQVIKSPGDFRFWQSLLPVVIFFTGLIFLLWKLKNKLAWFFFFWFAGSLSLVLNIFPLDMTIAERWLYFPLIGFLGLSFSVISHKFVKVGGWLFLGLIIILFSTRTIIRTFDWRNGLVLFGHDIKFNQQAFDLENNYGVELFRAGKIAEAKSHFEKSIELQPNWWISFNNLGVVYEREGDVQKARQLYQKSIANGDYYLAYENLAFLMLKTEDLGETIEFIEGALKKLPLNFRLRTALVVAHYRNNNYNEALLEAKRLFQLNPTLETRQLLEAIIRREKI